MENTPNDTTWIEIDAEKVERNIATLRSILGESVVIAPIVKSNAYGHGLPLFSKLLYKLGIKWFCITCPEDIPIIRRNVLTANILLLGALPLFNLENLIQEQTRFSINSMQELERIHDVASKLNTIVRVHICVDSGMSRMGIQAKDVESVVIRSTTMPYITIEGIYTHYATADEQDHTSFFEKQHNTFRTVLAQTRRYIPHPLLVHSANTAAIIRAKDAHYTFVRPGEAIYGYHPSEWIRTISQENNYQFEPCLSFYTRVVAIDSIEKGMFIGYSCSYETKRKTKIALLPVGYTEVLDRRLSNKGWVLINGAKANILGNISMNLTVVDITNIPDVEIGTKVTIFGRDGNLTISVEDHAQLCNTINAEILSHLPNAIPRHITWPEASITSQEPIFSAVLASSQTRIH